MQDTQLPQLFARLWEAYSAITPCAPRIHALMAQRGETVVNDHVAFRTFDLDPIRIDALAAPFVDAGYAPTGEYHFEVKKLFARSYSHPTGEHPRVFISELKTAEFSEDLQHVARQLAAQVAQRGLRGPELLCAPSWAKVPYSIYEALRAESEYAGWLAAFGIRANHFTVSVNALEGFGGVPALNDWLEAEGFALNDAGGKVKGSPEVLLEQSSTMAERVEWTFAEGQVAQVPSCYYEFALRHPDPSTGALYDGFVEKSADRIFESTDAKD